MKLTDYQQHAARTAPTHLDAKARRTNAAMMIVGEFGEVVDVLKKHLFQGHDLDRDKLREELGDVMWGCSECFTIDDLPIECGTWAYEDYTLVQMAHSVAEMAMAMERRGWAGNYTHIVAMVCTLIERHGFTLSEVLEHNVEKLRSRYPDGFSEEASRNRGDQ